MKLKKIIAFFFLLALSFQILPLKQLGSLLFSCELQEEVAGAVDVEKEKDKLVKGLYSMASSIQLSFRTIAESLKYIPFKTTLPPSHEGEIHTPPPNYA
jgi:hypothetical protein